MTLNANQVRLTAATPETVCGEKYCRVGVGPQIPRPSLSLVLQGVFRPLFLSLYLHSIQRWEEFPRSRQSSEVAQYALFSIFKTSVSYHAL